MDPWEKLKALSGAIAAVVLPVVLLVVGNNFSAATKERELQGKFVELASQVLREAPREETKNLRQWATDVINRYSGVPMSAAAQKDLVEQTALPALVQSVVAPSTQWGVVFGADSELDKAKYEVEVAGPKVGVDGGLIYLRGKVYRSVAVFTQRSDAEDALAKARNRRADAYIVDMASWCPVSVQQAGYRQCSAP